LFSLYTVTDGHPPMTDGHAGLMKDVALKQGILAISSKAVSDYRSTCGWPHSPSLFVHAVSASIYPSVRAAGGTICNGWERREADSHPAEAGVALLGDGCRQAAEPKSLCVTHFLLASKNLSLWLPI